MTLDLSFGLFSPGLVHFSKSSQRCWHGAARPFPHLAQYWNPSWKWPYLCPTS